MHEQLAEYLLKGTEENLATLEVQAAALEVQAFVKLSLGGNLAIQEAREKIIGFLFQLTHNPQALFKGATLPPKTTHIKDYLLTVLAAAFIVGNYDLMGLVKEARITVADIHKEHTAKMRRAKAEKPENRSQEQAEREAIIAEAGTRPRKIMHVRVNERLVKAGKEEISAHTFYRWIAKLKLRRADRKNCHS